MIYLELKEIKVKYEELLLNNKNKSNEKKEDINEKQKTESKFKILSISENNNFFILNYDINYNEVNINSSILI